MAENSETDLYLKVREKEGRLYSDEIVSQLPLFAKNHALSNEWQIRFQSAERLKKYFAQKNTHLKILDLGCGNGWLSNFLAQDNHFVFGVDQNLFELKQAARVFLSSAEDGGKSRGVCGVDQNKTELKQAARVFLSSAEDGGKSKRNKKLSFLEADIFSAPFLKESFDVILLASAIQYFPDLTHLIKTLLNYLKPNGEIHILDSAFYTDDEIPQAIKRSEEYYASLGFPEMSGYYFHHRISELEKTSPKWLYRPNLFSLHLKKILQKVASPFPWVVIQK